MIEIKTNIINNNKISHVIFYPDGINRILTMKSYEWGWFDIVVKNGYPFNEILKKAQMLAVDRPTGKGYSNDVLRSTHTMLRVIIQGIHEEKYPVANDIF